MVGLVITINVVIARHQPMLALAAACIVVGLHFFPLARGIPQPLYYWTGAAMTVLGLAGLAAQALVPPVLVGLGGATILWLTIAAIIRQAKALRPPALS